MSHSEALARYRDEVLRWNASINLVSRRDTETRLDALLDQCGDALDSWEQAAEPLGLDVAGREILYVDIGSGGGLPAAAWHERLAAAAGSLRTVLVEPRDKRAWFLERVARGFAKPIPTVLGHRWGEGSPPESSVPDLVTVSLKALRLTDAEVLAGLADFLTGDASADLAIARFHPADQEWNDELVSSLGIPAHGTELRGSGWRAEASASGVVSAVGVNLVVSRYLYRKS